MKMKSIGMVMILAMSCVYGQDREPMRAVDFQAVKPGGELMRRRNLQMQHLFRYQTSQRKPGGKLFHDLDKDILEHWVNRLSVEEGGRKVLLRYSAIGKFLEAAVCYGASTGNPEIISEKDRVLKILLNSQDPDGYFGFIKRDYADVEDSSHLFVNWTVHDGVYLCMALAEDYRRFGNQQSLDAAESFYQLVMDQWYQAPEEPGGCSPIGIVEAGLMLYEITNNKDYLKFAADTPFDGRYIDMESIRKWRQKLHTSRKYDRKIEQEKMAHKVHTYRYFSRCLDQLNLYRTEPDEGLLATSRHALDKMLDRQRPGMFISGATGRQEGWVDDQNGVRKTGEYCAIAYQIWWLGRLIEIDGKLQYGDLIERTLLNHVYGAQNPEDGRERYMVNINGKRSYEKGAHCCQGNFHRSLARMPGYIFYTFDNGIAVNLYTPCESKIKLQSTEVRLKQRTDYPVSGDIEIDVEPSREKDFALRLRIPKWAEKFNVMVNNKPVATKQVEGGIEILRKWKKGDTVKLQLPMKWRWVQGRRFNEGHYALMRGPQVFSLSQRYNPDLKDYSWRDITVDPESLSSPSQKDQRLKQRNGQMCTAKAWSPKSDRSLPPDIKLIFTDFPEESAMETFFKLSDATGTMEDELYK